MDIIYAFDIDVRNEWSIPVGVLHILVQIFCMLEFGIFCGHAFNICLLLFFHLFHVNFFVVLVIFWICLYEFLCFLFDLCIVYYLRHVSMNLNVARLQ